VTDQLLLDELERRMARLGSIFDLSRLEDQGTTAAGIRDYYEHSRAGYRFVHSAQGAMHMALNPDGTFSPVGYEGQAELVHDRLPPAARDVLELACGNGYNLKLLAERNPGVRFVGVDLVASQIQRARAALAELPRADARVGDFQSLAIGDGAQDCVYAIESLCHATDLQQALREAARVLRPGGRLIVIDGWRTVAFEGLPQIVRDATLAVERAMAVSAGRSLPQWRRVASECSLQVTEELDLTSQIEPNLARLEGVAQRFVSRPRLARMSRAVAPETLLMNAVAAYLMPLVVRAGAHTYRLLTLDRS
jgi:ubiquinone/menaquinone biosynthesis C-methylase UbiE